MATYSGPTINESVATGATITRVDADYSGTVLVVTLILAAHPAVGVWRIYVTLDDNSQIYHKVNVNVNSGNLSHTFMADTIGTGKKPVEIDSYFSHEGV